MDWRTQLDTLRGLEADGKIRYVGVTHYQLGAFDELEQIMETQHVEFVPLPYNLAVRDAETRLLPCAQKTSTAVLVVRPFDAGALFKATNGPDLPPLAAEIGCDSWAQSSWRSLPDIRR